MEKKGAFLAAREAWAKKFEKKEKEVESIEEEKEEVEEEEKKDGTSVANAIDLSDEMPIKRRKIEKESIEIVDIEEVEEIERRDVNKEKNDIKKERKEKQCDDIENQENTSMKTQESKNKKKNKNHEKNTNNEKKLQSPFKLFYTPVAPQSQAVPLDSLFPNTVYKTYVFAMQIDVEFLASQVMKNTSCQPEVTVVTQDLYNEEECDRHGFHVTKINVNLRGWQLHHSKMIVNFHQLGTLEHKKFAMEVIITTCNFTAAEFYYMGNMFWQSPMLPKSKEATQHAFQKELIEYFVVYESLGLQNLQFEIGQHDFSQVKASFIWSCPMKQSSDIGFVKLDKALRSHNLHKTNAKIKLLAHCSSLGKAYKDSPVAHMLTHVLSPIACGHAYPLIPGIESFSDLETKVDPCILFPTKEDIVKAEGNGVSKSFIFQGPKPDLDSRRLLGSKFFKRNTVQETQQIGKFLNNHAKVYLASDNYSQLGTQLRIETISWAMIGSFNLSKSAWGQPVRGNKVTGTNYECGVMISPAHYAETGEIRADSRDPKIVMKPVFNTNYAGNSLDDAQIIPIRLPFKFPVIKCDLSEIY